MPTRQDLERVVEWCDTDPPFSWLKGIAGVAMAVHSVLPIGSPSPGTSALWRGGVGLLGSGPGISEFPDEPVRFKGTLTAIRGPAGQPKLTIRANADRVVAKLSGGDIPAAWGADFEVEHIRDEQGLIRADWTLLDPGAGSEQPEELLFELLMWTALGRNSDIGFP